TSSIKGFATLIIVSILISFLTVDYVKRLLLGFLVKSILLYMFFILFGVRHEEIKYIADPTERESKIFNRALNIVKHRKKFYTITSVLVIIGAISLMIFKINPGIDFTSGSRIEILADEAISTEEVEQGLSDLGLEAKAIVISGDENDTAVTRYDTVLSEEQIADVKEYFQGKYGHEPSVSVVSPIVGEELVKNAVYALAIAAVGMIIYVTLRFEFFFGITTIIALLHDAFIILAVFSLARIEFDVTIVAAILTIIGYSINN